MWRRGCYDKDHYRLNTMAIERDQRHCVLVQEPPRTSSALLAPSSPATPILAPATSAALQHPAIRLSFTSWRQLLNPSQPSIPVLAGSAKTGRHPVAQPAPIALAPAQRFAPARQLLKFREQLHPISQPPATSTPTAAVATATWPFRPIESSHKPRGALLLLMLMLKESQYLIHVSAAVLLCEWGHACKRQQG